MTRLLPLSLLLIFSLGISCFGGDTIDMDGFLYSTVGPQDQTVPAQPVVSVAGQADQFTFDLRATDPPSWPVRFKMKGLLKNEAYIFQVATGGSDDIHTTISFPISVSSSVPLALGVLTTVQYGLIVENATKCSGCVEENGNANFPWIFGMTDHGGNNTYTSVQLVGRDDNQPVTSARGPYYFTGQPDPGRIVDSHAFADTFGTYVFFSVPAGIYKLQFFQGTQVASESDVIVLDGAISYGFDVP